MNASSTLKKRKRIIEQSSLEINNNKLKKKKKKKKKKNHNNNNNNNSNNNKNPNLKIITEQEHNKCVNLFRNVNWNEVQNTSRLNVIGNKAKKNAKGKSYCHSFIFGKNMKSSTGELSYFSTEYPELYKALKKLIKKYHPNHTYTNITINKNLTCKLHQDKGNEGPSFIIGFGKYEHGRLMVLPPHSNSSGSTNKKFTYYNCLKTFIPFNGKTQPHKTENFKGERYTAVFYKTTMLKNSNEKSNSSRSSKNKSVVPSPDKNSSLFKNFQKLKQQMIKKKL